VPIAAAVMLQSNDHMAALSFITAALFLLSYITWVWCWQSGLRAMEPAPAANLLDSFLLTMRA